MAGHAPMTRSSVPPSFDQYPRLVQRLLGVPVSLVTLVDEERQSFLGMAGLGEPFCTTRETPLNMSICKHVVHDAAPLGHAPESKLRRRQQDGAVANRDA